MPMIYANLAILNVVNALVYRRLAIHVIMAIIWLKVTNAWTALHVVKSVQMDKFVKLVMTRLLKQTWDAGAN